MENSATRRPPMVHELKTWTGFFEDMFTGRKNFEVRRDDRGYREGDLLRLREFIADEDKKVGGTYTGRELRQRVTYVMRGPMLGLQAGWVIMGVEFVASVR